MTATADLASPSRVLPEIALRLLPILSLLLLGPVSLGAQAQEPPVRELDRIFASFDGTDTPGCANSGSGRRGCMT
jgi:hypothetical protein